MTLPIDEQQLLMCAHENCELWQVASAIAEVAPGTNDAVVERARSLLRRYLTRGWIALVRHRLGDPSFEEPLTNDEATVLVQNDRNWDAPTGPVDASIAVAVVRLTGPGEDAMDRGAASDAFGRIARPPSEG